MWLVATAAAVALSLSTPAAPRCTAAVCRAPRASVPLLQDDIDHFDDDDDLNDAEVDTSGPLIERVTPQSPAPEKIGGVGSAPP